ncbi:RNA-directed RNA polymerase 2 [Marasmius fiardii PR-910]|nr:RNA-directed RNA polymerase 2 [Marasmius fiardii PR-910]
MEVFMCDIAYSTTKNDLIQKLAAIFHGPDYNGRFGPLPVNFNVRLLHNVGPQRQGGRNHNGKGFLTLPYRNVAALFLSEYGHHDNQRAPQKTLMIGARVVRFFPGQHEPRYEVLKKLRREPYIDPTAAEKKEYREQFTTENTVSVKSFSFGWMCRDWVYSPEWELLCVPTATLSFNPDRREIRIRVRHPTYPNGHLAIVMRLSRIRSTYFFDLEDPVIFFDMAYPPSFEREPAAVGQRERLPHLPVPSHDRLAPFISHSLRIVCSSQRDFDIFSELARLVQLHCNRDSSEVVERRSLFSLDRLDILQRYLAKMPWCMAFQMESILYRQLADVQELLQLVPAIEDIRRKHGARYAAKFLRHFQNKLSTLWWDEEELTVDECFSHARISFSDGPSLTPTEGSLFEAYHVTITPTRMRLEGPVPERSNRVIRFYHESCHDSFLRVSFLDEDYAQFRFDREIDGPGFIRLRVGEFLLNGLSISGRNFSFLAYSQSALKEHAVWFVKPFYDPQNRRRVDAIDIISRLGRFDDELMRCPARYAARISQAFTATDATLVEVEEIILGDDIQTPDHEYSFTDGVGTMSRELSRAIWKELKASKRRSRKNRTKVAAYQIRLMGSKGMLSTDYKLEGMTLTLRPSMIKFQAPDSQQIEIARAFDRPGLYYLNRPLIMLLEGLGVPYKTFEAYQDKAVKQAENAARSLEGAARMLESCGLGTSYRLTSVLLSLSRLGIDNLAWDTFYQKMMQYAVHHVLRMLKNHARIPIPKAWSLVGVADVHRFLEEGQIFACVKPIDSPAIYLEGPVLISRSPTVHPGDVQVVQAIGPPPEGSCFAYESLPNTVVFSVRGERPLPSYLGGGDLDGDLYSLIPLNDLPEFRPEKTCPPAKYKQVERKMLDCPSTMKDVAEFVMEFIIGDVIGLIATNWLIIADQSQENIFDPDCLKLSELHSDAVDYPKSGNPVLPQRIPRLKFKIKPDWQAPETLNTTNTADFYQSQRAIGRLFRRIDLPPLHSDVPLTQRERRMIREGRDTNRRDVNATTRALANARLSDDPLVEVMENYVGKYIPTRRRASRDKRDHVARIFARYRSEFLGILRDHTLSHGPNVLLSEEEAIIGTIAQKTSQHRQRKEYMAKLRERTDTLVRGVREELDGNDEMTAEESLEQAWLAWDLALKEPKKSIGAQSFGWVVLGGIFDATKEIDDSRRSRAGSNWSRH